MGVISWYEKI